MQKLLFIMLLLAPAGIWAQGYTVTGTVKDSTGKTIAGAMVQLLQDADTATLRTTANEQGAYSFKDIAQGVYTLRIKATGHTTPDKILNIDADIPNIAVVMQPGNQVLQEVTVSSKKPYIETGLGKKILNIDQATTAAGSSALDLLRTSPGVMVDGNNNISLQGTGALVLIDDKQTYMSGDQLADYLKGMSADQVAQLELITQPSSKYDAEGVGGIINIKTRKLRKRGFNGNIGTSVGQARYANNHNNANITWRKDDLTLYANAGHMTATGFLDASVDRTVSDAGSKQQLATQKQHTFMKEVFEDYNLQLGADYDVNKKLTIGASAKGVLHPNNQVDTTIVAIHDLLKNELTYSKATTRHGFKRYYLQANAYAKYNVAKDYDININADYLIRDHNEYVDLQSYNYDAQMQGIAGNLLLRGTQQSYIAPVAVKADYTGELSKDWKVEAGLKSSYAYVHKPVALEQLEGTEWKYDSTRSNEFTYTESINAAYANTTCQLSKQWMAQAGLRMEQLHATGLQTVSNQSFVRDNVGLFPTVFVSYKPTEKHSFEANYGRRIERPTYTELDPFIRFISQYLYQTGNPALLPSYRNYVELTHNYNNVLFTSVSGARVKGVYNPVIVYDEVTKALTQKPVNNSNRYVIHVSCAANKQLLDWWLLGAGGDYFYNQFEDMVTGAQVASSNGASAYLNNQFTFGKWTIDTLYQYTSGDLQSMIERNRSTHYLSAGIARKIWKDTASIRLSAEDPFATYAYRSQVRTDAVRGDGDMKFATQMFSLGFNYNFGKQADNVRQRNYNPDEAKRM